MTSHQSVHEAFARVRGRHGDTVASIVHLAAYYNFNGEHSPFYEQNDVQGTSRLLDVKCAELVEQFLFSSTMLLMLLMLWSSTCRHVVGR